MFRQACFLVTIFCAACCMAGKNHNHKTHTTYSNKSLSRIPSNLSVTRTSLAFDHNHIRNITNNTFVGSKQLTSLTIAFNNLSLIEANAFRGLTHLSRLNLDYNKITTVENYFVPDLGNLTYLDLAGNDIRIISQHALDHLVKLKVLILGKNSISSIHKHAFTKLTKLQILDLQSNELTVPSQYWFTFSKLTTLNFKANNWICDCHVLKYQRWLMKQSRTHNNLYDIQCQEPQRVSGHKLSTIHSSGLSCPPATVSVPHHAQTTTTHAHPHVASTTTQQLIEHTLQQKHMRIHMWLQQQQQQQQQLQQQPNQQL
nr:reticulon-4 receptor-like 2 [Ciona intestinalis]|eukprot:XP_002130844.2 reticulon-4 receptor-like 2 [Ciona intestinalis]